MRMWTDTQRIGFAVLLLHLVILAPSSGHADIYAWTDADGVRHFANRPPPDNAATVWLRQEIRSPAAADHRRPADDMRRIDRQARTRRDRVWGNQGGVARTRRNRRPAAVSEAPRGGRNNATLRPERRDREPPEQNRRVRRRPSKRERGVSSGLVRTVRAIPSPYYMGYRPVYSHSRGYRSNRGSQGTSNVNRGRGGARGSGQRARASFYKNDI